MIKLALRKNLIYLLILYIGGLLRQIISLLIEENFHIDVSYINLFLMTLGVFVGGLTVYIYYIFLLERKKLLNILELI